MHLHIHAGAFADARLPSHDLVNFSQLHPIAPHLDHPVLPAVEDQIAVLIPGHLIPAVIQARSGPEGVFRKPLCRFLRQIVVSVRRPGTADAQLADGAGFLNALSVFVQQPHLHPAARLPQACGAAASGRMHQRAETFAGTISLQHSRRIFAALRLLPRENHIFQRWVSIQLLQDAVHLGRTEHAGNLPFREQCMDHLHVFPFRLAGDIHAAAAAQHRRKIQQARDEADAGNIQRPGMLRHGNLPGEHRGRAAQDGLPVHHALGLSGGAGGIQNVALRVRIGKIQGQIRLRNILPLRENLLQQQGGHLLDLSRSGLCGEAQGAVHILQDAAHPLRGIFPVNGHHRATGPQHRKHRHNEVLDPGKQHGNPLPPGGGQDFLRQIRGSPVHFLIAVGSPNIQQGRGLRVPFRVFKKQLYNGIRHFFSSATVISRLPSISGIR